MSSGSEARLGQVEALVFDVFGTVVDWRASVVRELEALGRRKGLDRDWPRFADRWRQGYIEGVMRVNAGDEPWTTVDEIHRAYLLRLLGKFEVPDLPEGELEDMNRVWHRLDPWPDSVHGLARLRSSYIVCTLSNGNVSLLVDMARHAHLPWDCVLSAEFVRRYKPDPSVYLFAARTLGRNPERVMMVAAHAPDLMAARSAGLRTAFVERPAEYGLGRPAFPPPDGIEFDVHAVDLEDLATQLGVP